MDKFISGLVKIAAEKKVSPRVKVYLSNFDDPESKWVGTQFAFSREISQEQLSSLLESGLEELLTVFSDGLGIKEDV